MLHIEEDGVRNKSRNLLILHGIKATQNQEKLLLSIAKTTLDFNRRLSFVNNLKNIFLAITLEELIEIYKLRSKIYSKMNYDKEFPDVIEGLNFDDYDKHSAIIYTKNNGKISGTCRLIFDHDKHKLPIDKHYSLDYLRKEGKRLAELSRLVIEHESKGLSQEFKTLTQGVYFVMINNNISHTMSVMSEEHYRWYDKFGGFGVEKRFENYGNLEKPFIITSWDVAEISNFFKRVFLH